PTFQDRPGGEMHQESRQPRHHNRDIGRMSNRTVRAENDSAPARGAWDDRGMTRIRPTWPDLPAPVRDAVAARLGGPVTAWASHDGGFSPGWALTLETAAGRAFVKVAS